jgi:streptogrisin D
MPAMASRAVDTVPYYGGAFIVNGNTGCTSGFGVTGNNGAATYLITAAHCGTGTWTNGAGTSIGTVVSTRSTGRDAELILTSAGGGVYWGAAVNGDTGDPGSNTYVNVSGDAANSAGRHIGQSGSYSGTQCNCAIVAVNVTITYSEAENGVQKVTNLVEAQSTDDTAFMGQGDSGGPVTSLASNGSVTALGINSGISTGSDLRTCKGWAYNGRECSWIAYYADLQGAEAALGVHINTL